MTLGLIIIASIATSVVSLVGIFTLLMNKTLTQKLLLIFISLSAGIMMGGTFFHLLPEALTQLPINTALFITLISFILFLLIEKLLHWRHCHDGVCDNHNTLGYMNLIGDGLHNLIDGLIIAGAFLTDIKLGIVITLGVVLHEIPQELSDFGVLVYSGFSKKRALFFNLFSAITSVLGALIGYFASFYITDLSSFLLPLAAGGFLYVSASDLIPEIREQTNLNRSRVAVATFLLGILLSYGMTLMKLD